MEIKTDRLLIRSFSYDDAHSLAKYADNPEVAKTLRDRFPSPYRFEDAVEFISFQQTQENETAFAIEFDGEVIGAIGYEPQQDVARYSVEIGFWIGEPFWGRGFVTEAVKAFVKYLFDNYNIVRVFAHHFTTNPASGRVLEKAGFFKEAVLKKAVVKNGQIHNMIVYAVTLDDNEIEKRLSK